MNKQQTPSEPTGQTKGTITIEVEGGCVINVSGLPDGWDYELLDYDNCPDCGGADCEAGNISSCPSIEEEGD